MAKLKNKSDEIAQVVAPFWRIKYRPSKLIEIKPYLTEIYDQFQGYIKEKNFPNLLLVGPKGSGKVTLAEILAREILGEDFEMNYLLLHADDPISKEDRRIAANEARISTKRIGSGAGTQRRYRPFIQLLVKPFISSQKMGHVPFKILCVKNFHDLDVEQQAFRRIMEQYSNNVRIILITDQVSNIIDPILSRCQIIFVPYISEQISNKILKNICDKENLEINLDLLNKIRFLSQNNLGKALDYLQLTFLNYQNISMESIDKMNFELESGLIHALFEKTVFGAFKDIRKILRDIFYQRSFSKKEILQELCKLIFEVPIPRDVRNLYLSLFADSDFSSIYSSDDEIQLQELLSKMSLIGKDVKNYLGR